MYNGAMSSYPIEKVVYLIRHGQSEHNILPVYQAPTAELSNHGKVQASKIAQRIAAISFDTLISSPFARAKSTAEEISTLTGKDVEYSNLFVERIKPTVVNGKPFTDLAATEVYKEWRKTMHTTGEKVLDGENFEEIVQRADDALAFLERRSEKNIVVVSHSYFIHTILARILLRESLTPEAFRNFHRYIFLENTGITVLRYQGGFDSMNNWRLWIHNDHAHLGE